MTTPRPRRFQPLTATEARRLLHAAHGDRLHALYETAQLTHRLNNLGVRPNQARSTALLQLATEIPAAILARTLGIHTDVAVAWQRHSAGDWAAYAADVSRRAPRHFDSSNI